MNFKTDMQLRLGYFLALRDVAFVDMRGRYRGVDRLWFTPDLSGNGELRREPGELGEIWERYHDALYDKQLNVDRALARDLVMDFSRHGILLEAIYAEVLGAQSITKIPTSSNRWKNRRRTGAPYITL